MGRHNVWQFAEDQVRTFDAELDRLEQDHDQRLRQEQDRFEVERARLYREHETLIDQTPEEEARESLRQRLSELVSQLDNEHQQRLEEEQDRFHQELSEPLTEPLTPADPPIASSEPRLPPPIPPGGLGSLSTAGTGTRGSSASGGSLPPTAAGPAVGVAPGGVPSADMDEACTPEGATRTNPRNSLGTPIQIGAENCGHSVIQGMIRDTDGVTFVDEVRLFPGQTGGSNELAFADELRRFGAQVEIVDNVSAPHLQQMLNEGKQVAVGIRTRGTGEHWVRVEAVRAGQVYFGDPYNGHSYTMPIGEFDAVMVRQGVVTAKWPNGVQTPALAPSGNLAGGGSQRTGWMFEDEYRVTRRADGSASRVSVPFDERLVDLDVQRQRGGEAFNFQKGDSLHPMVNGRPTDTVPSSERAEVDRVHTNMIREGVAVRELSELGDVQARWSDSTLRRDALRGVLWGDPARDFVVSSLPPGSSDSAPDMIALGRDEAGRTVIHMAEGKGTDLPGAFAQFEQGRRAADARGILVGTQTIYGPPDGTARINRNAETTNLRVNPVTGIVETRPVLSEMPVRYGPWEPRLVNGRPVRFVEVEVRPQVDPGSNRVARTGTGTSPRVATQRGNAGVSTEPSRSMGLSERINQRLAAMGIENRVVVMRDADGVVFKVFDVDGNLVDRVPFEPKSPRSIRSTVLRFVGNRSRQITPLTLHKALGILETAGRWLFLYDAAKAFGDLTQVESRIYLLNRYADLLQAAGRAAAQSDWSLVSGDLAKWSLDLSGKTGSFATAGGNFLMMLEVNWLSTYGAEALAEQDAEFLFYMGRKTREVAARLQAELNRSRGLVLDDADIGEATAVTMRPGPEVTRQGAKPVQPPPIRRVQLAAPADYSDMSRGDLEAAIGEGAKDVAWLRSEIESAELYSADLDRWEARNRAEYPTADATNGSEFQRSDREQIEFELTQIEQSRATGKARLERLNTRLAESQTDLTRLVTQRLQRFGQGNEEWLIERGEPSSWSLPFAPALAPVIAARAVELATADRAATGDPRRAFAKVGAAIALIVLTAFAGSQLFVADGGVAEEQPESVLRFLESPTPAPPGLVPGGTTNVAPPPSVLTYLLDAMPQLQLQGVERDAVSGAGSFNPTRVNVTDPGAAFSSLPMIPTRINEAGGKVTYNADQATAPTPSGIYSRQNSVLWFGTEADAVGVVDVMAAQYPTAFQDYVPLATTDGLHGYCFTGRFGTGATQSYWAGCGVQHLNVIAASYFGSQRPISSESFLSAIAAYHRRVRGAIDAGAVSLPAAPLATASGGQSAPQAPPSENRPPVVTSLISTLAVPITTYRISAEDPDGDAIRYSWFMGGAEKCGTPKVDWGPVDGAEVKWSHANERPDLCTHAAPLHDVIATVVVQAGAHRVECVVRGSDSRRWDPTEVCALQRQ